MPRLYLKTVLLIVLFFTALLFYTGWHLQQQSLAALRSRLPTKPPPPPPPAPPSTIPPSLALASALAKTAVITSITDLEHTCAAVQLFASLHTSGSQAKRVLHYPAAWDSSHRHSRTSSRLFKVARDRWKVLLVPVDTPGLQSMAGETGYERVLAVHSVGVFQRNPDAELLRDGPDIVGVRDPQNPERLGEAWVLIRPGRLSLQGRPLHVVAQRRAEIRAWWPVVLPVAQLAEEKRCGECWDEWDADKIRVGSGYVSFLGERIPWYSGRGYGGGVGRVYDDWQKGRADICGLDLVAEHPK